MFFDGYNIQIMSWYTIFTVINHSLYKILSVKKQVFVKNLNNLNKSGSLTDSLNLILCELVRRPESYELL